MSEERLYRTNWLNGVQTWRLYPNLLSNEEPWGSMIQTPYTAFENFAVRVLSDLLDTCTHEPNCKWLQPGQIPGMNDAWEHPFSCTVDMIWQNIPAHNPQNKNIIWFLSKFSGSFPTFSTKPATLLAMFRYNPPLVTFKLCHHWLQSYIVPVYPAESKIPIAINMKLVVKPLAVDHLLL